MRPDLLAYGERAYLVRNLSDRARLVLTGRLEASPFADFEEYVLGHSNLLVVFKKPVPRTLVDDWLESIDLEQSVVVKSPRTHKVPVHYDGPDLESVAELTGLSEEMIISIHTSVTYTVRMIGFTPGFPYLDGLDPRLHLDRRGSPRNRIEPGAVAIGGPHAGIYSVASPGGWHLLGRTEKVLFDPAKSKGKIDGAEEAFLLKPGDRVRFVPQGGR